VRGPYEYDGDLRFPADFVWDKEKLDVAKPDEVVPGNNMKPYGGLASADDRTKLIAFLQSP
jgi:cytochrome c